jgi:hypothetical protein
MPMYLAEGLWRRQASLLRTAALALRQGERPSKGKSQSHNRDDADCK